MKQLKFIFACLFVIISASSLISQTQDEDYVAGNETGAQFPSEAPGSVSNAIPPDREALGKFPKVKGPQVSPDLRIASQTQNEIRKNYFILEGYVDITHTGMRLQSDHAEYDANSKDLIATGNVVLDQEGQHMTGDRLELNLETKKGVMYNARGFVPPQIFFWGKKLEKLDDDTYRIHDGVFTECSQIVPHWRLNTTTAKMTVDEYIRFNNFTLKAKQIPIFYSPFMLWPIKRDRATGFLFPAFGPNDQKGFYVGGSFFWAMMNSMDSTYWVDHYQERGWGGGGEYRYAASKESSGFVKAYMMDDRLIGREWTANGNVKQELPSSFRLAGVVDYFSSYDYVTEYANSLQRALSQTKTAQLFLTRNWSYYGLNILTNWQERETGNSNKGSSYYHLPEIEFQSRSQKLGPTPFFGALLTSGDHLGRRNTTAAGVSNSFQYQRYDMFPSVSWPITYLSWVTFTPTYGHRWTYYSKHTGALGTVDESFLRTYSDLTLDLRGPNFSKIFDTPNSGYSKKWKHAIEPQITFHYREDIENRLQIITLDDVDFVLGERVVTYSLTNLLYSKRPVKDEPDYESDEYQYYNPKPLEEPAESAWEFLSWKIQQTYRLDSDSFKLEDAQGQPRYSPISSILRVNPTVHYNIDFTVDYHVKARQITSMRLRSTLRSKDRWYSNVSYAYSKQVIFPQPGQPQVNLRANNSLQLNAGVGLWKRRVVLNGNAGYNITDKELLNGAFGIEYNDDCFSVGVNWRHFSDRLRFGGNENQITFSISLPNIGNLVDFQSGTPPGRF
ncbi:MAG TPA: LptA/OstA family protein [Acidobacteriota bacterium]|nr:LptA/OstA family protein [Acidobacteriota bacterium]